METQTCGTYDFKYFIEFSRNDIYKFTYFPRAIMWNSLPSEIVSPESLNSFENNLGNNLQD